MKRTSVRKWYLKEYPTDRICGEDIKADITFEDIIIGMYFREDFYKITFNGYGDSVVRERIFEKLAEMYGVDYGLIYEMWLGDKENKISLEKDFGIRVAFC